MARIEAEVGNSDITVTFGMPVHVFQSVADGWDNSYVDPWRKQILDVLVHLLPVEMFSFWAEMSSLVRGFGKHSVQPRGSLGAVENTDSCFCVLYSTRSIAVSSVFRV